MEVWIVTVFESGDGTTSVWAVYDNEKVAEDCKEDLLADKELNSDGNYLVVNIKGHEVLSTNEEESHE